MFSIFAILLGTVIGAIEAGFGWGIELVAFLRTNYLYWFLPFLALAGVLIVFVFKKYGSSISRGMGMLFDVWTGKSDKIPLRTIPLMIGSTLLTHLFGGSTGREGVAVQVGASLAHTAGKKLKFEDARKTFVIVGAAAGFAGLFRTPLAAIAFSMEMIVVGESRFGALFFATLGAFAASIVSSLLGINPDAFTIENAISIDFLNGAKLVFVAILFSLVGMLFAMLLHMCHRGFSRAFKNPYVGIAVIGVLVSVIMILTQGRYSGPGGNIIEDCFVNGNVLWEDWILKLLLTVLCLSAGFKGGEVAPLLAIGTAFGMFFGPIIGLPATLCAALGSVAVFASGTGTLLAPIFIGCELFGWQLAPLFILVCFISKFANRFITIYKDQENGYMLQSRF